MDLAKKDKAQLTVNETAFLSVIEPSALKKWRKDIDIQSETFFHRISTYGLDIDSQVQLRAEIIDSAQSTYAAIVDDYAEKENVDLIVIGTTGKTGFKRILLGSVALGVITYATCPVLVVK